MFPLVLKRFRCVPFERQPHYCSLRGNLTSRLSRAWPWTRRLQTFVSRLLHHLPFDEFVEDTRYERLIRNALRQGSLLQRSEILGRKPNIDPTILGKGSRRSLSMPREFLTLILDPLQLSGFERIEDFLLVWAQFTHLIHQYIVLSPCDSG